MAEEPVALGVWRTHLCAHQPINTSSKVHGEKATIDIRQNRDQTEVVVQRSVEVLGECAQRREPVAHGDVDEVVSLRGSQSRKRKRIAIKEKSTLSPRRRPNHALHVRRKAPEGLDLRAHHHEDG
jgi:hypothetical protein